MEPLALLAGAAAGLAGLLYLLGRARRAARVLDAIQALVERELEHNHGGSIKDDVHGTAVAVGVLQRRVSDLEREYRAHVAESLRRKEIRR